MGVKVTNVGNAIRAMRQQVKNTKVKMADGLRKAGETIKRRADKYCPVDTGALKKTGRVEYNEKAGLAAEVTVAYGGKDAPYALWVHENLEAYHQPPTCARWITKATRESRGTVTNAVKRQIQSDLVKTIDGTVVD